MADTAEKAQSGESDVLIYLLCRVAAAVFNIVAVALFTRLSDAHLYGEYLIGFSICFIVYSLTVQWAVFAHFGTYTQAAADRFAGSLLVVSAVMAVPALGVIALLAALGTLEIHIAWGSAFLAVCFTAYFASTEIARARLRPGLVAIATILRSALSMMLGCIALVMFDSPTALLMAIGIAYALGAVPIFVFLSRTSWAKGFVWPQRRDVLGMLRYGWPLIFAFGASAGALNIDRIVLEHYTNAAAVAPYGAVMDLMKQTFLVLAEAISAGYIAHARKHMLNADGHEVGQVLRRSFVSQVFIVVFGSVAFLVLGRLVFGIILAPSYVDLALEVMPYLLIGNAILIMRAHYFGQIIYLGASSLLELVASVAMVAAAVAAAFALVPGMGPPGAAFAFAIGQVVALVILVIGAPASARMPIDWVSAGLLVATGFSLVVIGMALQVLLGRILGDIVNIVLIGAVSAFFAVRWNIFNIGEVAGKLMNRLARA
ncbi:lipopolysaccharide biosynthesis protein [Neorhizobium sp. NPDC001467]|uniref:lipopolysaccharide biosynthesis protein n=1 Tax=Neorhizobium sp. NPDC001467 TaxID=3390595 RepID=UPI003D033387